MAAPLSRHPAPATGTHSAKAPTHFFGHNHNKQPATTKANEATTIATATNSKCSESKKAVVQLSDGPFQGRVAKNFVFIGFSALNSYNNTTLEDFDDPNHRWSREHSDLCCLTTPFHRYRGDSVLNCLTSREAVNRPC